MEQNRQEIESIVAAVLRELDKDQSGAGPSGGAGDTSHAGGAVGAASGGGMGTGASSGSAGELIIDLPDPTTKEMRAEPGVKNPFDLEGLRNLKSATGARVGVGRAGTRPLTSSLLLFQADHGVTQDAIHSEVESEVLEKAGLFSVQTCVADREEYLLRPDLGRTLSEEAKTTIRERCTMSPNVQVVVGDGLSAAAINNNVTEILPVIEQGLKSAGISMGTPFFIKYARVGVINSVNDVINADAVIILIGERPGLGVADAMSAYMGYKPTKGKTDGERDAFCMITRNGGTNPLEAGAFIVEQIKKYLKYQASGVELRLKVSGENT